jgi:hypothetical protein
MRTKFWWKNPAVKRPLETYSRGSKYDIKTRFIEINWDIVEWTNMAQDRENLRALVNTVMNLWVP